jgi:hypothetical protein
MSSTNNASPENKSLQLYIVVVEEPNLFARLKSWHPNIRATITPKGISQAAISTGSNLSLDSKVHLSEVVGTKFEGLELSISIRPLSGIFSGNLLGESTGAVLARSTTLANPRGTLRS